MILIIRTPDNAIESNGPDYDYCYQLRAELIAAPDFRPGLTVADFELVWVPDDFDQGGDFTDPRVNWTLEQKEENLRGYYNAALDNTMVYRSSDYAYPDPQDGAVWNAKKAALKNLLLNHNFDLGWYDFIVWPDGFTHV